MIQIKLKKWGNSIGAILPNEKLKEFGLSKGDIIEIDILRKKRINGFGICKGAESFEEEKETHEKFW